MSTYWAILTECDEMHIYRRFEFGLVHIYLKIASLSIVMCGDLRIDLLVNHLWL